MKRPIGKEEPSSLQQEKKKGKRKNGLKGYFI